MAVKNQYTEENIRSLDWKEHIRMRPGMYIGKLGDGSSPDDGIYILLKEVLDNSIDEFVMGAGKTIEVSVQSSKVVVRDYGRGIPLGKLIDVVSKMNTGGKYDSEVLVEQSNINHTILRISGVSIPVFQEPPSEWPFLPNQKIEFIHRDDVVTSICNSVNNKEAYGQMFNISGGKSWQITGEKYVKDYFEILEVDMENAVYQKEEGHFSWYESSKSNKILQYQNNNYENYLAQIRQDLNNLMGE